jgi:hypothetical protein
MQTLSAQFTLSKPVEFHGFKIRVIKMLPDTREFYSIAVSYLGQVILPELAVSLFPPSHFCKIIRLIPSPR